MTNEIKFDLTPQKIRSGVKLFWLSHYIWMRAILPSTILLGLFVIGSALNPNIPSKYFFWGGVYLLFIWAVSIGAFFLIMDKKMKLYESVGIEGIKLKFDEKGIILSGKNHESKYLWTQLKAAKISGEILLLLWGGVNFSIIPINESTSNLLGLIPSRNDKKIIRPPIIFENERLISIKRNNKNGWWVVFAFFVCGLIGLIFIIIWIGKVFSLHS